MKGNKMKRAMAAVALFAGASLGLAACGSSAEPEAKPDTETSTTEEVVEEEVVEEEAEPADDQSVEEACLLLAGPMADAQKQLLELASESIDLASQITADPTAAMTQVQASMDLWKSTAESWESIGTAFTEYDKSVTNADVKAVSAPLAADATKLGEVISKVYVDLDFTAVDQVEAANEAFSSSYEALVDVCGTPSE